MDTHWTWNSDFFVFKRNRNTLVVKNDVNGALVSLSPEEYDFLIAYSQHNSLEHIQGSLKNVHASNDVCQALIDKAKELHLLEIKTKGKPHAKQKNWQMQLYYLGMRFCQLMSRVFRLKFVAEFRGNLRFFKLFSVDLNGSWWQRISQSLSVQKLFWPLIIILYGTLFGILFLHPKASFAFAGFAMTSVPAMGLFLILLCCIFFCLFWHESGHYFVYKRYGGEGDIIGLGTMFVVFPVLYTQIDDTCLWNNRRQKLLLSAAGIVMDGLVLLVLCNILCFYHETNLWSMVIACLFFYYVVQIFTNLNPFFPGTDGYYILEDLLGLQRLYGDSFEEAMTFWKELKTFSIRKRNCREWMSIAYFATAAVCISVYWLLITSLLTFPLWSNLVL